MGGWRYLAWKEKSEVSSRGKDGGSGDVLVKLHVVVSALKVFRQLVLSKELDLATLDDECILCEIDARLVSLEHVEAEEQVDVASLRAEREGSAPQRRGSRNTAEDVPP